MGGESGREHSDAHDLRMLGGDMKGEVASEPGADEADR